MANNDQIDLAQSVGRFPFFQPCQFEHPINVKKAQNAGYLLAMSGNGTKRTLFAFLNHVCFVGQSGHQ